MTTRERTEAEILAEIKREIMLYENAGWFYRLLYKRSYKRWLRAVSK